MKINQKGGGAVLKQLSFDLLTDLITTSAIFVNMYTFGILEAI